MTYQMTQKDDSTFAKRLVDTLPALDRYAYKLCRNKQMAEDLVQSCLERALEKEYLFEAGTNIKSWLFKIMHNLHCNNYNRAKRMSDVDIDNVIHLRQEPAHQVDSIEFKETMQAFGELPEKYREVLYLVAVDGYSYEETADIIGINIGTVKSRISRARERLLYIQDNHRFAPAQDKIAVNVGQ